ncbi:MAG: acyl-CoA dehydrogenase [Isosphaeraceae bacterium]|jgi:alkylation response protein AidB-like acyl-CoA dehydrogenase|nr:MAG: acyl-CoA dehydrogenase [Isosphaeraceae bacterium]
MDALWSEPERLAYEDALAFAREHLAFDPRDHDRAGKLWREGYLTCGSRLFPGLCIPTQFGGRGLSYPETLAAMEGLGYGCPDTGLLFALNASLWTVAMPIAQFGTDAQRQRWLPGLSNGSLLGANAASEPNAGSDIFSLQTQATRDADSWILNGRKTWITAAPAADLFLLFATTDPSRGPLGISAFLIPANTPGFQVVRTIPKLGMRTAPMGEILLNNCRLPAESLLGREGRGARIFQFALEWERGAILAPMLGTLRRQLDRCLDFARSRKQFGQPIAKFQAVSHRLVDMAIRLESCRPFLLAFARTKAAGRDALALASMAKIHLSEAFLQNSLDAIRTLGAYGYSEDAGIERDLRDSVGGVLFSGTNDIQRNIIAQSLRL